MRKTIGLTALVAYIGTVAAANFAINAWGIVPIGFGLAAPAGVYFAGLAFTLRDVTHEALGRGYVLAGIAAGAALSYVVAVVWPGSNPFVSAARLAIASAVAFGLSELADYAVFAPMRRRGWLRAVVFSNIAGLVADSILFLWIAFGSLAFLEGQIVGKALMTGAAVAVLAVLGGQRRAVQA